LQTYTIVVLFPGKYYNYYTLQPVEAIQHRYREDFTRTAPIDTQATSSRLNTLAGSSTAWSMPIGPPAGKPSAGHGKNSRGERSASVVYFCLLWAPGFVQPRKMTLIE